MDSHTSGTDRRYDALMAVARLLEMGTTPARYFPALHERVRDALPGGFVAALTTDGRPFHVVYREGDADPCEALIVAESARLRRGDAVVEVDGADSLVAVPLWRRGHVLGCLAIGRRDGRRYTLDDIELLRAVAGVAAVAVENARLHHEMHETSLTDALVGIPSRRQLELILEREFAAAVRGRPLAFALFDLDHFQAYNEMFGYREGDRALVRFADVLTRETRAMNVAARFGGEQFATVVSGSDTEGARQYAEHIRRSVLRETSGMLSVSVGVAVYGPTMAGPVDLVVAADRALGRAKAEGRNRVCVAGG